MSEFRPCVAGYFPHIPPSTPGPLGFEIKPRAPIGLPEQSPRMSSGKTGGADGEYGCLVAVGGSKRCPQCWQLKAYPEAFDGRKNCNACRYNPHKHMGRKERFAL